MRLPHFFRKPPKDTPDDIAEADEVYLAEMVRRAMRTPRDVDLGIFASDEPFHHARRLQDD